MNPYRSSPNHIESLKQILNSGFITESRKFNTATQNSDAILGQITCAPTKYLLNKALSPSRDRGPSSVPEMQKNRFLESLGVGPSFFPLAEEFLRPKKKEDQDKELIGLKGYGDRRKQEVWGRYPWPDLTCWIFSREKQFQNGPTTQKFYRSSETNGKRDYPIHLAVPGEAVPPPDQWKYLSLCLANRLNGYFYFPSLFPKITSLPKIEKWDTISGRWVAGISPLLHGLVRIRNAGRFLVGSTGVACRPVTWAWTAPDLRQAWRMFCSSLAEIWDVFFIIWEWGNFFFCGCVGNIRWIWDILRTNRMVLFIVKVNETACDR
jgi:hypothetical protein